MLAFQQEKTQRQTLTISQSSIQACNILSMSIDELHSYIQDAITENPLISFESLPPLSPYGSAVDLSLAKERNITYAESLSLSSNVFHQTSSLNEHLLLQIPQHIEPSQKRILRYLIHSLDQDGYFRDSTVDTARILSCTEAEVKTALSALQGMDPPGIGARNLQECILLQLKHQLPESECAYHIIKDHFSAFTKNQLKRIAKTLRCNLSAVYDAMETIRQQNPRPAAMFTDTNTRYIVPDITINGQEEDFRISLNPAAVFEIKLDDTYSSVFNCGDDDQAKRWLRDKRRQASMLQLFVEKRNSTLLLVCDAIFQAQKPFFHKGPEYLRPLKQKEIANTLNCHESTVFRAVKGKYLACSWGVFPLTYFFSNHLDCEEGFDPCNPKQMIKALIEQEDKFAPISDSVIADRLTEQGVQISRRTVAKYRDEAGIPTAAMRKKYSE